MKFVIRQSGFEPDVTVLCLSDDGKITYAVCNLEVSDSIDGDGLYTVTVTPFDQEDGDTVHPDHAYKIIPWEHDEVEGGIEDTIEELALKEFTRVEIGPQASWPMQPEDFSREVRLLSWQAMAVRVFNADVGDDADIGDFDDEQLEAYLRVGTVPPLGSFSSMADGGAS